MTVSSPENTARFRPRIGRGLKAFGLTAALAASGIMLAAPAAQASNPQSATAFEITKVNDAGEPLSGVGFKIASHDCQVFTELTTIDPDKLEQAWADHAQWSEQNQAYREAITDTKWHFVDEVVRLYELAEKPDFEHTSVEGFMTETLANAQTDVEEAEAALAEDPTNAAAQARLDKAQNIFDELTVAMTAYKDAVKAFRDHNPTLWENGDALVQLAVGDVVYTDDEGKLPLIWSSSCVTELEEVVPAGYLPVEGNVVLDTSWGDHTSGIGGNSVVTDTSEVDMTIPGRSPFASDISRLVEIEVTNYVEPEGEGGVPEEPEEPGNPEEPGEEPEEPGEEPEGPETPGENPEEPGENPETPGENPEEPGETPEEPKEPETPGEQPLTPIIPDGTSGADGNDGTDGTGDAGGKTPVNDGGPKKGAITGLAETGSNDALLLGGAGALILAAGGTMLAAARRKQAGGAADTE